MITIKLDHYDRETEVAITSAKTGISRPEAEKIVDIVRGFREIGNHSSNATIRACIMIAKLLKAWGARAIINDTNFVGVTLDVLDSDLTNTHDRSKIQEAILDLIKRHC